MEAFGSLRTTTAGAQRPRAIGPESGGPLAGLGEFDGLVGVQPRSAAIAAADSRPTKIPASAERAPSTEADKRTTKEISADPPATAILLAEPQTPPSNVARPLLRADAIAENDESPSDSPSVADKGFHATAAETTEDRASDLIAASLLIGPFALDPLQTAGPASTWQPPTVGQADGSTRAAKAALHAPPIAPTFERSGLSASANTEEADVGGGAGIRIERDVARPVADFAPVEAFTRDSALPAQSASFVPEGVVSADITPGGAKVPGGAETPTGPRAATAQPAELQSARSAPFDLAIVSRRIDGGLEIRLDPPDLGSVSIQFFEDGAGALQASILADRGETLDLLRRHADFLQRELARQGAGDFILSFSDRREGGAHAQANGVRDGRIIRFGEAPEAFVREFVWPAYAPTADGVDLIA